MINYFWFRRDLRLEDNRGLAEALKGPHPVKAIFIFDTEILNSLQSKKDPRVSFIYHQLIKLDKKIKKLGIDGNWSGFDMSGVFTSPAFGLNELIIDKTNKAKPI